MYKTLTLSFFCASWCLAESNLVDKKQIVSLSTAAVIHKYPNINTNTLHLHEIKYTLSMKQKDTKLFANKPSDVITVTFLQSPDIDSSEIKLLPNATKTTTVSKTVNVRLNIDGTIRSVGSGNFSSTTSSSSSRKSK